MLKLEAQSKQPVSSAAIAGSLSGASVRLLTNPLDVIKIRWQLQLEVISSNPLEQRKWNQGYRSEYQSLYQTFNHIRTEEGIAGFWKGHLSGQLLAITYNTVQFMLFKYLSGKVHKKDCFAKGSFLESFVIGGISGSGATCAAMPFDVLRTRLVSQHNSLQSEKLGCATRNILQKDGVKGFFRGLTPALLQTFPAAGLSFGYYYQFQSLLEPVLAPSVLSFVAGALSGTAVKFCIHPLDVFKKRLIIQGFAGANKFNGRFAEYRGMTDCVITMMREEGIRGMFKGLTPNVIKGAFSTGLSFGFFELYSALLSNQH